MTRPAVWVGRALALLGFAAGLGVMRRFPGPGLAAWVAGALCVGGLTLPPLVRRWLGGPQTWASDYRHVMELLCRAHGARAAWAAGLAGGDLEALGADPPARDVLERGGALVQLATADGRAQVMRRAEGTYVAVGDFPFAAGVLLRASGAEPAQTEAAAADLRRIVAALRLGAEFARGERGELVAKQLAAIAGGAVTLEGVAKAGVELAQQFAQRGAALVARGGPAAQEYQVLAVSSGADHRLLNVRIAESAPAARAIQTGVPVVSQGREDLLGSGLPDRRRQERAGTAYPVLDGHFAIAALVVFGPAAEPDSALHEQLQRLLLELGSRLAAARAVHEAEQRAVLDPLTGLRNRRELERVLSRQRLLDDEPAAALIYLDLDRFKALNDELGHAAGDAALRHVAAILSDAVRDGDLAARIGGEEFAVWMPQTRLDQAGEVAERIRRTIEGTPWHWNGTPRPLTASFGVAGVPESTREPDNLRAAADAALYRAKQSGRNRVEKATGFG